MGEGMDQTAARRRAKEISGIAVSARKGTTGKWVTGGWPSDNDAWIVLSLDGLVVLDDGMYHAEEKVPVVPVEEEASMVLAKEHPAAVRNDQGRTVSAGFVTSRDTGGRVWVQHRAPYPAEVSSEKLAAGRRQVVASYAKTLRREGWRVTDNGSHTPHPCLVVYPPAK